VRPTEVLPLLLLVLAGCASSSSDEAPLERPNIVFVLTDDHAAAALSAYTASLGSPALNHTPNLDRLAAQGVLFENAFCTNGICAPSRAVFLTGKHSHVNGVRDNGARFDGGQDTFPKRLHAAGYQTALFGKWHLKSDPTGFDRWEILPGQGNYYSPDFRSAAGERRIPGYVTDVTTDLALEWLRDERDDQRPFLLMVQHKAPHRTWMPGPDHLDLYDGVEIPEPRTLFDDYDGRTDAARQQEMEIARHMSTFYDLKVPPLDPEAPLEGPDRWAEGLLDRMSPEQRAAWDEAFAEENAAFRAAGLEGRELVRWKYQRYLKNYLRSIAAVDDGVGRLMDELERQGLAENTIFVYTSDQGFFLGEHGWYDKRFMYEPSLRMPLIVRWPAAIRGDRREPRLVQNLDLAPTLLEAAGVAPYADIQGASLLPILQGEAVADWREAIYYQYYEVGIHAVQPHYGVRTERHKLIHFHLLDQWELYDLERDPDEVENLYGAPGTEQLTVELKRELARLRAVYRVPEDT